MAWQRHTERDARNGIVEFPDALAICRDIRPHVASAGQEQGLMTHEDVAQRFGKPTIIEPAERLCPVGICCVVSYDLD